MAGKIFNGHTDSDQKTKEEAIAIAEGKVEKYVGNKQGVVSLHLFESKKAWTCATNNSKHLVENEEGVKEVKKFDVPENK